MRNGTHYERAFEGFIRQRRLHCVAVDQTRRAMCCGVRIKSFDFLVYPPNRLPVLTDVKGRKLSYSAFQRGRLGESWTTTDDIEGLKCWQETFGSGYSAVFVFAYWLCGPKPCIPADQIDSQPPGDTAEIFAFEGRLYVFKVVELNHYCLGMRPRSASWKTVYVPARIFRHLAQPCESFMPARRRRFKSARRNWQVSRPDRRWPIRFEAIDLAVPAG